MSDVKIFEFPWQMVVEGIKRTRGMVKWIYVLHEARRITTPFIKVINNVLLGGPFILLRSSVVGGSPF